MVTVSAQRVQEILVLEKMSELYQAEEKSKILSNIYQMSFAEFERKVNNPEIPENFKEWDDYVLWQGYQSEIESLQQEINELKNGNYRIA